MPIIDFEIKGLDLNHMNEEGTRILDSLSKAIDGPIYYRIGRIRMNPYYPPTLCQSLPHI